MVAVFAAITALTALTALAWFALGCVFVAHAFGRRAKLTWERWRRACFSRLKAARIRATTTATPAAATAASKRFAFGLASFAYGVV